MNFIDKDLIINWNLDYELAFFDEEFYQKNKDFLKPHLASETYNNKRIITYSPLSLIIANKKNLDTVCKINNLFFAGEHIKTSITYPSMGKAAESGQRAAIEIAKREDNLINNIVLKEYNAEPFQIFKSLDRLLYKFQQ
jgi:uncharacterized protein with NAD-binding domain and iron-sulfur cluster